jgi:hypothetical protein
MSRIFFLVFLLSALNAQAYEVSTHRAMNQAIANHSILSKSDAVDQLGLPGLEKNIPSLNQTVIGLFAEGGVFEDGDLRGVSIGGYNQCRVFNHFFDPQYNKGGGRGLEVLKGFVKGNPSPRWALGDTGQLTDNTFVGYTSACASTPGKNFNSYVDASVSFYKYYTSASVFEREQALGDMLRSLGAVVHHIEDMGQPQHTRNDTHTHGDRGLQGLLYGEDPYAAQYERYFFHKKLESVDQIESLMFCATPTESCSGYSTVPDFDSAEDFWWSTGTGLGYKGRLRGMADFTSQNFTSSGTQFYSGLSVGSGEYNFYPDAQFQFPGLKDQETYSSRQLVSEKVVHINPFNGNSIAGSRQYYVGTGYDGLTNAKTPTIYFGMLPGLNSFSYLSGDVRLMHDDKVIANNVSILLPRIGSFGVGLLNHFFRARIKVARGSGNNKWVITNAGSKALDGSVELYVRDKDVQRQVLARSAFSQAPGGVATLISTESVDPGANSKDLIAVFYGKAGVEGNTSLNPADGFTSSPGVSNRKLAVAGAKLTIPPNATNVTLSVDAKTFTEKAGSFARASVSGAVGQPVGVLSFFVDGASYGSPQNVTNASSLAQALKLKPGAHNVGVSFVASNAFESKDAGPVSVSVLGDTSLQLTGPTGNVASGGSAVFTAKLNRLGNSTVAGGRVVFKDNGQQFADVLVSGDSAAATRTGFVQGGHTLTADYSGDTYYASSSSSVGVTVDPPPVPCGGQISPSGGSAGYSTNMDLGTSPGVVKGNFEAYSIPDSLEIKGPKGNVLYTTNGLVSSSRGFSFNYDSSALGGRVVSVRVNGNTDASTVWRLSVSCPGGSVSTPKAIRFIVGVTYSSNWSPCGSNQIYVDGVSKAKLDGGFRSQYLEVTEGGTHSINVAVDQTGCFSQLALDNRSSGGVYFEINGVTVYMTVGRTYYLNTGNANASSFN